MDEPPLDSRFEAMFAEADRRGAEMMNTEPRALSARYDAGSDRIVVELINGCTLIVPVSNLQDFQNIERDERLADIVVEGLGFNINWPGLDIDLYTPALVAGIFGTKRWMEKALARRAGQAKSPAKAAAARENGKKGGRPRKVA
jgi:Protein of unknown function (DUF2442)